jgi:carboxyl-terminal processing protease
MINKIILDLRNNPGGLVDQSVSLAEYFIPEGLITKLVFKNRSEEPSEFYSNSNSSGYELVVLVNEMSASASEIVAGAVQDTEAGIIVGSTTYGKARVQSLIPVLTPEAFDKYKEKTGENIINAYDLITGHRINPLKTEIMGWSKMTTGYYFTPDDRMIDGVGITPDITVEYDPVINDVNINGIQTLTMTSKPGLNDEGSDVLNAQKILKVLGYEIDIADGIIDDMTFAAISEYRTDKSFWPGGVLDFTTQKALNEDLETLLKFNDKQYAKALEILK